MVIDKRKRELNMKINLFLDMDGTIAKFNSKKNALERFDKEKGFFSSLKPFKYIEIINQQIKENNNINVFIISASPNEEADKDKQQWLSHYLPNLSTKNICFCRLGENKAIAIKQQLNITIDEHCYLLDDYTNNLIEWQKSNGIGIKRITSLANNKSKRWQGLTVRDLRQLFNFFD